MLRANDPIGVFDSGIGGLSILQALLQKMPEENFVYVADSAFNPYGERDADFLNDRIGRIVDYLIVQHQVKAVVVACNTATAVAIDRMRALYPTIEIIGVEPALKPAALVSQTKRVGVIGTRATLTSARFKNLQEDLEKKHQVSFVVQPCDGLASAIENNIASLAVHPSKGGKPQDEIARLCDFFLRKMGDFGPEENHIDALVLGCTHYVFALPHIKAVIGDGIAILETGAPVAQHTAQVLKRHHGIRHSVQDTSPWLKIYTTGAVHHIQAAVAQWLGPLEVDCAAIVIPESSERYS